MTVSLLCVFLGWAGFKRLYPEPGYLLMYDINYCFNSKGDCHY